MVPVIATNTGWLCTKKKALTHKICELNDWKKVVDWVICCFSLSLRKESSEKNHVNEEVVDWEHCRLLPELCNITGTHHGCDYQVFMNTSSFSTKQILSAISSTLTTSPGKRIKLFIVLWLADIISLQFDVFIYQCPLVLLQTHEHAF